MPPRRNEKNPMGDLVDADVMAVADWASKRNNEAQSAYSNDMALQKAKREEDYASQSPLAEDEIMGVMLQNENAQTDYGNLDGRTKEAFRNYYNDKYGANVANQIPSIWNRAARKASGNTRIGIPEGADATVQVDENGRESISYKPRTSNTPILTKGEEAVDTNYAKELNDWNTGGMQDTAKSLAQLDEARQSLADKTKNISGPITGLMPQGLLAFTNPDAISTREQIEEVVQRNLRQVLGAQFTEKEGERLIKRAFNPQLDEKENATRLNRLIGQIKGAARAKQDAANYFTQYGTLKGWQGRMPTMSDFNPEADVDNGQQEPARRVDESSRGKVPQQQPQRRQITDQYGYTIGQDYPDGRGNRAVYLGNGKWQPIKKK